MLMRHMANSTLRLAKLSSAISVEYNIVRSVDGVVHSFCSCIGRS